MGLKIANNAVAFQFCRGQSPTMANEMWLYQGGTEEQRQLGLMYQFASLSIGTTLMAVEVGLYTVLFG